MDLSNPLTRIFVECENIELLGVINLFSDDNAEEIDEANIKRIIDYFTSTYSPLAHHP